MITINSELIYSKIILFPLSIYMFKVNNKNNGRCEICPELKTKDTKNDVN